VFLIRWALCLCALCYVLHTSSPPQISDLLSMQPIRSALSELERRIR
jgi:hypothetical protein